VGQELEARVFICKGTQVRFKMKDGCTIKARGAMLHDPVGHSWPRCSLLIAPFQRGGRAATEAEKDGAPKEYLGRTHEYHVGKLDRPPSSLSEWERVGEVATIYYVRPGRKAPGRFYHHFGQRRLAAFYKKGKAILYKRGSMYRVELARGCIVDGRGIVFS
jgi:hypothetical protein